jgi:hypothetical protein
MTKLAAQFFAQLMGTDKLQGHYRMSQGVRCCTFCYQAEVLCSRGWRDDFLITRREKAEKPILGTRV